MNSMGDHYIEHVDHNQIHIWIWKRGNWTQSNQLHVTHKKLDSVRNKGYNWQFLSLLIPQNMRNIGTRHFHVLYHSWLSRVGVAWQWSIIQFAHRESNINQAAQPLPDKTYEYYWCPYITFSKVYLHILKCFSILKSTLRSQAGWLIFTAWGHLWKWKQL